MAFDRRSLITVNNQTNYSLVFLSKEEIDGYWLTYKSEIPENSITPFASIVMKDYFGPYGTRGSIMYSISGTPHSFQMRVACPMKDGNEASWEYPPPGPHPDIKFSPPTFSSSGSPLQANFTMLLKGAFEALPQSSTSVSDAESSVGSESNEGPEANKADISDPEEQTDFSLAEVELGEAPGPKDGSGAAINPAGVRLLVLSNASATQEMLPVVWFEGREVAYQITPESILPGRKIQIDLSLIAQRLEIREGSRYYIGIKGNLLGIQWVTSTASVLSFQQDASRSTVTIYQVI